jgi:energy-converting hydrogenase Eha subunit B
MTVTSATTAAPTSAERIARAIAIGALILLGLGALAGGITLVTAPDGSAMGFSLDLLAGSPFPDYLVPGLVLGGLFGVGSFVTAWLGWRRHPVAPFLAFAIGCGQMIWIVVQLAIIGTENLSFLHPAMFLVGLVIAVAAVPWGWPTFRQWRAARA